MPNLDYSWNIFFRLDFSCTSCAAQGQQKKYSGSDSQEGAESYSQYSLPIMPATRPRLITLPLRAAMLCI